MATQTTNYDLTKPAGSDFYNVAIGNSNSDKIDTQMKKNADRIQGKNLLHNWDFRNPVNQRSGSVYTAHNSYTIDRWKYEVAEVPTGGSITLNSGSISFAAASNTQLFLKQYLETPLISGKIYTFSVQISPETFYSVEITGGTSSYPTFFTGLGCQYDAVANNIGFIVSAANTVAVVAVKLELGSVSSLASDTTADFAEQLSLCQRFFYSSKSVSYSHSGIAASTSVICADVKFPVPMRIPPTVAFYNGANANRIRQTLVDGDTSFGTLVLMGISTLGFAIIYDTTTSGFVSGALYDFSITASADL